jgi:hypothetical protein
MIGALTAIHLLYSHGTAFVENLLALYSEMRFLSVSLKYASGKAS